VIFPEEPENSDDEQFSEEEAALRLSESEEPLFRTFMVSYLGESSKRDEQYDAKSGTKSDGIAPVGMYTTGWDWLNNLKVGDRIDCCDEYHKWYKCYILCAREKQGD